MSKNTVFLIVILLFTGILTACGPAATPEPTALPIPTNTPEPEATATAVRVDSGLLIYGADGWTTLYEDEITSPFFLPEDMSGDMALNNQMIQYGYFSDYQPDINVLTIYARLLLANFYRPVQLQLTDGQKAACLPEAIEDTSIEDITFLYSNSGVGFPPGSGSVVFGDVASTLNDRTYFVVVLDEPIQADSINAVTKLGLVCP